MRLKSGRERRRATDAGFTLVETIIAMSIAALVFALSFTVISTVVKKTALSQSRSNAIDEARVGVEQLERQIRSGNVLYAPTYDSVNKDWVLQVYTQVNGNQRCVQWKVDSIAATLQFRSWSPSWQQDGDVTTWRTIARYVVNNPANSGDTPFTRSTSGGVYGTRLLDVHLLVKASGQAVTTTIDSSITGRNTTFGYDQAVCTSAIPGG